jgi:tetratricopeptide (TPR) repeat protein
MAPEALRDALVDAAEAGDQARVRKLAAEERDSIREHFASWQKVPEPIRADAQQTQRYVAGLIAVAEHFKRALGDSSLLDRVTGPPDGNPLVKWEKALHAAQDAIAAHRYPQAEVPLREWVATARGLKGPGVDRCLPITLGLIGQSCFHQGRAIEAVPLYLQALEICERTADRDGQIAHLSSLHEAQRWLGETAEAAAFAERPAECCEQAGNQERSDWARRRAFRVRQGEPLNRVVVEMGGKQIEIDELSAPLLDGRLSFHFVRNRMALGAVTALVEEGSRLGNSGDDASALGAFRAAAALDPSDPRPLYLSGLAQMCLCRYPDAIASYDATERLAPGWYHCRADRALALALASQRISHATFEAVRAIEDGGQPPTERAALADLALADAPDLPILYLLKANALIGMKCTAGAEEAARAGLARDPDPDVRTRLLVTLARVGKPPENQRLLEEAVALDGNRIAAAMARLILLAREVN